MAYEFHQKVLFRHCDPAQIVFFPRYFEMMNDCVEGFFADELNAPFEDLHQNGAVPTAQIETRFAAPSRHGDVLLLTLRIVSLGRSSVGYVITGTCGEELRFETSATIVNVTAQGRPIPWDDRLRLRLSEFKENTQ